MPATSFGALIRTRRQECERSLRDLATAVGISVAYLSRIERDREKPPRDDLIRRLAETLQIKEDDAFAMARRLPPDLRNQAAEVFAVYRRALR